MMPYICQYPEPPDRLAFGAVATIDTIQQELEYLDSLMSALDESLPGAGLAIPVSYPREPLREASKALGVLKDDLVEAFEHMQELYGLLSS